MTIVYISIGNSDDKLSQQRWAEFVAATEKVISQYARIKHGQWFSLPNSPWQNCVWCVEMSLGAAVTVKHLLAGTASKFDQDSIAWAEAPETLFLGPGS